MVGISPDWAEFAQTPLGKVCLVTPPVPRQENIIQCVLLALRLCSTIGVQLPNPKVVQHLTFLPR